MESLIRLYVQTYRQLGGRRTLKTASVYALLLLGCILIEAGMVTAGIIAWWYAHNQE